jgi:hypothetical protein
MDTYKDKITTGEIGKPLRVNDKGNIVTPRGVESINNNKLIDMYLRSGMLSDQAKDKLQERKNKITKYNAKEEKKGTFIQDDREFFYRMLSALESCLGCIY